MGGIIYRFTGTTAPNSELPQPPTANRPSLGGWTRNSAKRDPSASSGRSPPKRACGSRLSHRSRRQQVRNTPPQHTHTSLCAHNRRTHIMIKSHLYNLSSHLQIGLRRASLWWVCVSAWTQGLGSSSSKWRSCTRCSSLIGSAEGSTPSGTTTSLGSALGCAAAPSASGCCSASPLK